MNPGFTWVCRVHLGKQTRPAINEYMYQTAPLLKEILPSGNLTWLLKMTIYSGFTH